MEGVTIKHWVKTPARHQALFEERKLKDNAENHCLFALPGPAFLEVLVGSEAAAFHGSQQGSRPAFQVLLDVTQFQPEDILIQMFQGWLLVKAQHRCRMDEHGFVSRSFTRQYQLPEEIQAGGLQALLCHDGILVVESRHGEPDLQQRR